MNTFIKMIARGWEMLQGVTAPPPEKPEKIENAPRGAQDDRVLQIESRRIPSSAKPEAPESPIIALARQCREAGYEAGLNHISEEPDQFIATSLGEGARSAAKTLSRTPEEFAAVEKKLEERFIRLDQLLKVRRSDRQIAEANVRTYRDQLAAIENAGAYPTTNPLLRWSSAIGITLSLAPTIHDFFPGLFPILKWAIALGFAFAFSLVIVTAILPEDQPPQDEPLNQ